MFTSPKRLQITPEDKAVKAELDRLYIKNNTLKFIEDDPVQFPHRYTAPEDREIAAFLAATIAWGRRPLIINAAEKMFALMGESLYDYVMEGNYRNISDACVYRTFFGKDLRYFCKALKACYTRYGSLEALFASAGDFWEGISLFRQTAAQANKAAYSKHIANPDSNSACKRLHLALRWLTRREGPVDLGLWKSVSPDKLFIPLDVHVGRSARHLGFLPQGRKANDKKAVVALTEKLRELCPNDPVKYDLALFSYRF
ncbi:MAG: TIGR02757 family protein [Treponema sp.]|jgi:uncharacterized protein (TIGR02757 family)|nr:TIGR02757 family protein [Treponema sp.]